MNIETRDEIDTHLDDARVALRKARVALIRSGLWAANDWTILAALSHAREGLDIAVDALPTVHSLQAASNCLGCAECEQRGGGNGRHAIDCPNREAS